LLCGVNQRSRHGGSHKHCPHTVEHTHGIGSACRPCCVAWWPWVRVPRCELVSGMGALVNGDWCGVVSGVPPHVDCHHGWCGMALRVNTEQLGKVWQHLHHPPPPTRPHHPHIHIQQLATCHSFLLLTQFPVFKDNPTVCSNPPYGGHTVWRVGRVGRGAWERAWPHLTSFTPSPVEVRPNSVPGSWHMMGHVHTAVAEPKLKVQSCCPPMLLIPAAMSSG
jgi:hypothetical protein